MPSEPQSLEEMLAWTPNFPPAIIGNGLLYERTKAILYGRYKNMKSMLALDLGFSLSCGEPWIGFDTPPEGTSVLYFQLEIPYQLLRLRVSQSWKYRKVQNEKKKPFYFWTEQWLKLDQDAGLNLMRYQVKKLKPELLIIDPLYKVISGNLLSAFDAQRLIDNVDTLIGEFGVSVLLVSHTPKGITDMGEWGSDDLIGSSFFSNWADTIIKVERKGGDRLQVKFDIVRHAMEELDPREVMFNRETLTIDLIPTFKPGSQDGKDK